MGVIQKNDTSQMISGSPAQICGEQTELADAIFTSNSALLTWVQDFVLINDNDSATSAEIGTFKSSVAAVPAVARTHARARTQQP